MSVWCKEITKTIIMFNSPKQVTALYSKGFLTGGYICVLLCTEPEGTLCSCSIVYIILLVTVWFYVSNCKPNMAQASILLGAISTHKQGVEMQHRKTALKHQQQQNEIKLSRSLIIHCGEAFRARDCTSPCMLLHLVKNVRMKWTLTH